MKRTFIAIKVDLDEHRLKVLNQLERLFANEKIRWVKPENFHLTLHFFGETNQSTEKDLIQLFRTFASQQQPFSFDLSGFHIFKKGKQPHVLFVGADRASELTGMATKLKAELASMKIEGEGKSFKPHLTVARIKAIADTRSFFRALEEIDDLPPCEVWVKGLVFYESILKPDGPVYTPIQTFEFVT